METLSVKLPFEGFYESSHDALVNEELNMLFEIDDSGCESAIPDAVWGRTDFGAIYMAYVEIYTECFAQAFEYATGLELPVTFEDMISPKYYNFETDRVFAAVPLDALQAIYDDVMQGDCENLEQVLRERHTSRSGFISHYSNDIDDWKGKPLAEWDHNELESLIRACLIKYGEDFDDSDDFRGWNLMDDARGNGRISDIVYRNMPQEFLDFANFQREAGKPLDFAAWGESPEYALYKAECDGNEKDALSFGEWKAADRGEQVTSYRCPETTELFAGALIWRKNTL